MLLVLLAIHIAMVWLGESRSRCHGRKFKDSRVTPQICERRLCHGMSVEFWDAACWALSARRRLQMGRKSSSVSPTMMLTAPQV